MTEQEAKLWIKRFEGGSVDDEFRPSSDLSIVMRLMLNSHIKMATILRLTVDDYRNGSYVTMRGGLYEYSFEVTAEDDAIVEKHIKKNQLEKDDVLIQVSDRALRYKFQNVVKTYGYAGRRPEIGDFYFAGLGLENKPMNRT